MSHEKPSLEEIFHAAQDIADSKERREYLVRVCAGDAELRGRAEALLAAAEMETDFLSGPAVASPGDETREVEPPPATEPAESGGASVLSEGPGTIIGRYKLLQQIGEGGFGVVYMAEQHRPVRRRVALKVIKAGMDTRAVIARFEAERQALAMMEHPNIARVLDAGSTESGRPYFAMELVKGIPITEFCDEAKYDTRRRLELFVDVCQAVQHAHQKGIIHRDLKPSNVLVTLRDDRPVVKIIDFGIAKATEQRLTEKTLFTAFGQMVGTPVYMSPEQAVMSELDVDTRSDVYSLGVLLYELLTGATPIDPEELRSAGYDEIRRKIREDVPSKPSTRLSTMAPDVKLAVAARRHAIPNTLVRECDGDLDWIVLKALEKERTRRYQSASAFADDIARHLNSEPVTAVAPSSVYRLRKFVARNRLAVGAGLTVAVALIVGTVVSTWMALEAIEAESNMRSALGEKDAALRVLQEERTRAQQNADRATQAEQRAAVRLEQVEKANDVLAQIFDNLDPNEVARNERPLQQVLLEQLAEAIEAIDAEEVGEALNVAILQVKLGKALRALGEAKRSIPVLEKALETIETHPDASAMHLANTLLQLALSLDEAAEFERSLALKKRSLSLVEEVREPEDHSTLEGKLHVAMGYYNLGRYEECLRLRREVYDVRLEILPHDDRYTIKTESQLASALWDLGRRREAIEHQEHVREAYLEGPGPDDPETWAALHQLSIFYNEIGESQKALALAEEAWKRTAGLFGETHSLALHRKGVLVHALADTGEGARALDLAKDTFERLRAKHGEASPLAIRARNDLSEIYWGLDDTRSPGTSRSIELAATSFQLAEDRLGEHDPLTLNSLMLYSVYVSNESKFGKGIDLLELSRKRHTERFTEKHPMTVMAMYNLGFAYAMRKRHRDAVGLLERVLELREELELPPEHLPPLKSSLETLANVYKHLGKGPEAIRLREKLVEMERAKESPDPDEVYERLHKVAGLCEGFGRNKRSAEIHEEMLRILQKRYGENPGASGISRCRSCLVRLYRELEEWHEARRVLVDAIAVEEKEYGGHHQNVRQRRYALMEVLEKLGKPEEALRVLQDSLAAERKAPAGSETSLDHTLAQMSLLQLRLEKWEQAEATARECWELRRKQIPDSWLTPNAESMLGHALLGQKEFEEAEKHLVAGFEALFERRFTIPEKGKHRVDQALERLVRLYEERGAEGDAGSAEKYRKLLAIPR